MAPGLRILREAGIRFSDAASRPARLPGRGLPPFESLVAELAELIAIPSVSADPAHRGDVAAAAEWVADDLPGPAASPR